MQVKCRHEYRLIEIALGVTKQETTTLGYTIKWSCDWLALIGSYAVETREMLKTLTLKN